MKNVFIELLNPKTDTFVDAHLIAGLCNAKKEVKSLNDELNKKPNKAGKFWKITSIV